MEKKSENHRLMLAFCRNGLGQNEQLDFWALLNSYREAKNNYYQAPNMAIRDFLYEEVEEAKKNLDSFCKYYGLGPINYNELLIEV